MLVEAKNVTEENGLIGKRYSLDAQIAILANVAATDQHAQELREFETYRNECKQAVDELLNR